MRTLLYFRFFVNGMFPAPSAEFLILQFLLVGLLVLARIVIKALAGGAS